MKHTGTPLQAIKYVFDHLLKTGKGYDTCVEFLNDWMYGDFHWPHFAEFCAANPDEPEHRAADGTVRKAHYGTGRQPWDDMVDAGWAPHFAAGCVLKYVRRAAAKNGEDDLKKARWYHARLRDMVLAPDDFPGAYLALERLHKLLTDEEKGHLVEPQ